MSQYEQGLHILIEKSEVDIEKLNSFIDLKILLTNYIQLYSLNNVGEVFHSFEGGGYTATVCLSESHIAVHTWPEFGRVTFDVFLSNFSKNNDAITEAIANGMNNFFEGKVQNFTSLRR